jgi:ELWxxDGT repeat protein
MTSRVDTSNRGQTCARRAVLVALSMIVLCGVPAVSAEGALERTWTVATALKDGAIHVLGDFDGELYFISESRVWKTNGSVAGTVQLGDEVPLERFSLGICPIFSPVFARGVAANDLFFFSADDGVHGQELWATDGTVPGTRMVKDLTPSGSSTPYNFVPANSAVHFVTLDPFGAIWRSDGTDPGTSMLPGQTLPIATIDGFYLFMTNGELWRSDGTPGGTSLVRVIDPSGSSGATVLARDDGKIYFVAAPGPTLWVTDGTTGGTVPLLEWSGFSAVMICDGGICYFMFSTASGTQIVRTDGTPGGTTPVTEIADTQPRDLVAVNGTIYFLTLRGLWKTDGTAGGTEAVSSDPTTFPSSLTFWNGQLYFARTDGSNHHQLWRSDGTPVGTTSIADLGSSVNLPTIHALDGALVLGVWGAVLQDEGVTTTDAFRVAKFDPGTDQLVTLADLASRTVHCPTPLCSCNNATPPKSAVVGDKWFFEALDRVTFAPKLFVAEDVFFRDVTPDHWAFAAVEALAEAGLTTGCGTNTYCPDDVVSRAQMAVFLLRAIHGAGFVPPPPTGTVFSDVPVEHWAAAWIEQLAAEGLTTGCGGGEYCPDAAVTRAEMALFILRAEHGAAYTPPAATGTVFGDVPVGYWAARWIEQLALEGITTGCGGGNYCPEGQVTRAQMAVFLTRAFGL